MFELLGCLVFELIAADVVVRHGRVYTMAERVEPLVDHAVVIRHGRIVYVGPDAELSSRTPALVTSYDAAGNAVLPGLIDAHTHLAFAGDRIDEFSQRSAGKSYAEIAAAGGGIWRTVQATRAASFEELLALSRPRLEEMVRRGVTTIEAKGGYGLTLDDERKLLKVYRQLASEAGVELVTTFLGAHTVPKDGPSDYLQRTLDWLRTLHHEGLVDAVDIFVETGAFTPADAEATAAVAKQLGLPLHLHVDQLHAGEGAELAARLGAVSADHLEHMSATAAPALAAAGVAAVLVPYASLYVGRGAKPDIAALRREGVAMAIATDFNPGSAPALDLPAAAALAVGYFGLTVDEALLGMTRHAAAAIGRASSHGQLQPGGVGDVIVLNSPHAAALLYELGRERVQLVLKAGQRPLILAKSAAIGATAFLASPPGR